MPIKNRVKVVLIGAGALAATGLLLASPASAHVTVVAPGVTVGSSDATITFRVPDESASASTVGLKVQLPTDHPIAGVLVAPVPGWSATVKNTTLSTPIKTDDGTITEAVSEIDWQAQPNQGIKPNFFGQFSIIAGQLPDDVNSLTFKAIQTYSDGTTVSWIEEPAPGSTAEPEHPAPVLTLSAANAAAGPSTSASANSSEAASASTAGSVKTSDSSRGIATAGLVLGVVAVLLAAGAVGLAISQRRRPAN